jgi:hypothetical protein
MAGRVAAAAAATTTMSHNGENKKVSDNKWRALVINFGENNFIHQKVTNTDKLV